MPGKIRTLKKRPRSRQIGNVGIDNIAKKYHQFKTQDPTYEDVPGFVKVATLEEIAANDFVLTPGRYVGFADVEEDSEVFEEKMLRLTKELGKQFAEGIELEKEIRTNLKKIGYEF